MKKVIVLIAIMAMTVAQAQEGRKGERSERMKNVTPQEMATMQSKRMTLALDLTDNQEKEVYQVLLANADKRINSKVTKEDRDKLTKDQKKELKLALMDDRIAVKRNMKNILDDQQYAKWEEMMEKRSEKRSKGAKKRRNRE